jgi:hypothetical protein
MAITNRIEWCPKNEKRMGRSARSGEPIAARQAYFKALREHWPELLDSLLENVMPKYEPRWNGDNPHERFAYFESWGHLQTDSARRELLLALRGWAAQFHITEAWILQTALDTLQGCSGYPNTPFSFAGKPKTFFWFYAPRASHPEFKPKLNESFWYPQLETWGAFRSRTLAQFRANLDEYRRTVEARAGLRKRDTMERDAEWTVRFQKGEAPAEFANTLTGYEDSLQTVYRAIERFADEIGLNLRRITNRPHRRK